jgi:hypothetical protein
MEFLAVNCRSSLQSGKKDVGTGRCRFTIAQFKSLSINIGWVVRLALCFKGVTVKVLCTAWPELSSVTEDNVICVDDSVQISDRLIASDWIECKCKVSLGSNLALLYSEYLLTIAI